MRLINGTAELIAEICAILGIPAYGAGDVCVLPKSVGGRVKMLDGTEIATARAVVSASGFKERETLINALDRAAKKASAHYSGDGVMKISPLSPAVMTSSSEKGYFRFEQEYEITYMEGTL